MQWLSSAAPSDSAAPLLAHVERFLAVVALTAVTVGGVALYGLHVIGRTSQTASAAAAFATK